MEKMKFNKFWLLSFKLILTLIIFWALAQHSQFNFKLIYPIFSYPFATLAIILLCYVMVIFHAWRWYRLNFIQDIDLSFFRTIMPTYLGIAFNTILPGSVGGDFIRLYYVVKSFPQSKSRVVLIILVDRLIGLLGIFMCAFMIAPYYFQLFLQDKGLYNLLTVSMGLCASVIVLVFLFAMLFSKKIGLAHYLRTRFSHKSWFKMGMTLWQVVHGYKNSKWIIVETLIVSMLTQLLLVVVVIMLSKMMGLPMLSPLDYVLALVIGQLANLIPLTPGGVGLGEAAFANIILMLHPGSTAAYATVFFALRLLSTIAYLPGVIIGIFGFHLLNKNYLAQGIAVNAAEGTG